MHYLNKKTIIFFLFFLIMLTSFSQYYCSGRVPFTSADPILIFSRSKEYVNNVKNTNFSTWFPNYNLGINESGWDPHSAPFSLPNTIIASLPFDIITVHTITCHTTMALMGFAAFLLLSYLGFSRSLAFLGGLIYMFNPMTDEHHYIGFWTYAYIFTPIGIIIVHEWIKRNNRMLLLFLWGLLNGLLYLTGGISVLLYVFMGTFLYALALCLINRYESKQLISIVCFLSITGLIALSIGAYIFIPGVDTYIFKEIRPKIINTSFLYLSQFSLMGFIKGVLSFIFPWSLSMFATNYIYAVYDRNAIYIGSYWNYLNILMLPVILVLLTNWKSVSRRIKGLLVFIVIYYGLFLNPSIVNPNFILKIFPFYSFSKNYPIYYIIFTILIITTIQDLIAGKFQLNKKINIFVTWFCGFYFVAAFLFLVLVFISNFQIFAEWLKVFNEKISLFFGGRFTNVLLLRLLVNYTLQSTTTVFIFLLLLARGLQIWLFKKFNYKYFYLALIFLILVEYACFTRIYYPFLDKDTLRFNSQKTEENRFIRNLSPGTRIAYQRAKDPWKEYYQFEHDRELFKLPISKLKKISNEKYRFDYLYLYAVPFPPNLSFFGVYNLTMEKNFQEYYSRMAKGNPLYEKQIEDNYAYAYAYLYNVNEFSPLTRPIYSYLVTQNELDASHLTKVLKGKYYNIYKNELALPRAYFLTKTVYEPDISKGLDILESNKFDWENEAIVHDKESFVSSSLNKTKQYSIKEVKIFYNDVKIAIENDKTGILILNDLFYPYWKAIDNDKPIDLFRVNCIFRGVKLDPGKHVVKMHFHNPKLTIGIWVTLISTVICIIGVGYFYPKQKE